MSDRPWMEGGAPPLSAVCEFQVTDVLVLVRCPCGRGATSPAFQIIVKKWIPFIIDPSATTLWSPVLCLMVLRRHTEISNGGLASMSSLGVLARRQEAGYTRICASPLQRGFLKTCPRGRFLAGCLSTGRSACGGSGAGDKPMIQVPRRFLPTTRRSTTWVVALLAFTFLTIEDGNFEMKAGDAH